jgi:hypothetical protein
VAGWSPAKVAPRAGAPGGKCAGAPPLAASAPRLAGETAIGRDQFAPPERERAWSRSRTPGLAQDFRGEVRRWLWVGVFATAEVNLFDVRTNKLVWGGTTETFNPISVGRESAGFADVVIDALAKRGLVPGR